MNAETLEFIASSMGQLFYSAYVSINSVKMVAGLGLFDLGIVFAIMGMFIWGAVALTGGRDD